MSPLSSRNIEVTTGASGHADPLRTGILSWPSVIIRSMFSLEERDRVRDHVVHLARSDRRIVAGAVVGSLAGDGGDRWSDLDLTFGVADEVSGVEVLDEWTRELIQRFGAIHLIDLTVEAIVYRVFLLPECLQLDVSMAPASRFRARSSRFKLLFGSETAGEAPPAHAAEDLLGWALLFARHTRVQIERGRLWEAEYCLTNFRHYALSVACQRRDLPSSFGKGFEALPSEVLASFGQALLRSLEIDELKRALDAGVSALLRELVDDLDPNREARIKELIES